MEIQYRIDRLKKLLQIDQKKKRLSGLKGDLERTINWQDEQRLSTITTEISTLQKTLKEWQDLEEMLDIAFEDDLPDLLPQIIALEKKSLFSGQYDQNPVILQIYSGAGGVDAQDWAEMLLAMYSRFCQNHNLKLNLVDISHGQEAGIKNATLEIVGETAYGLLKSEHGVHRLVRQSPYNAKSLRQTSFALVEVIPEIKADLEVKIDDKDLKIDVFRSSGHGGQSVNTTDSAVRITHLPTGLVVSSQNQRSQLQNKETALRILKSRLLNLKEKQHKESISELRGEAISNEWGSQVRSYVLHPYKLVKDHRTGSESTNPDKVLAGDLDPFIEAFLEQQTDNNVRTSTDFIH